jgi:DNA helicase-4
MTDFEAQFGPAVSLKLGSTFRCPQALCDISSTFVMKNPRQLRKQVRSRVPDHALPVRVLQVSHEMGITRGIAQLLGELSSGVENASKRPTILLLGRYRGDEKYLIPLEKRPNVDARFSTVHSAKGQEADHVVVVRTTSEAKGFPSQIEDDPALRLAMPEGEGFPFAEERRVFYVALTRARKSVVLITVAGKESPFIRELVSDGRVPMTDLKGQGLSTRPCPGCQQGFVVPRVGKYGPFGGCSTYPLCEHTEKA